MRWLTNFYDFRFKWTTTEGIGIHLSKTWLSQLMNFKNSNLDFRRTTCNKIVLNLEKYHVMNAGSTAMTQRPRDRVPSGSMLVLPDPRRPDRANPFFWQHWHDLHALGSHGTDSHEEILCWGFKVVREEIPREEASTLQIGSVAFPAGQCTSLQFHPCHRLFDQNGHQDNSSASLKSRPCSQWLLLIP